MNDRWKQALKAPAAAMVVMLLGFVLTACGAPADPADPATADDMPRTPEGHPDFNGVWQAFTTAGWNILDHNAQNGCSGRTRHRRG